MCFSMATAHCLEMGGEHVAPDHLRLTLLCAEICETSAKFLMSNSDLHKETVAFLPRAAPIARMMANVSEIWMNVLTQPGLRGILQKMTAL